MRVMGYVRVSTDEQATQGVSLAAQTEKLNAYAGLYGLDLVAVVEDPGHSAKTLHRPGLQRALDALRAGQAHGLLVMRLDRLSRSVADMAALITQYFGTSAKVGAKLFSVVDQVDTRTSAGLLVLNILTSVAQWEREAISERTRAALAYKKAQGKRLGAPGLEDSDTVAFILAQRAAGQTYGRIATLLTAQGRPTQRGGQWAPETVRKLLVRHQTATA